MSILRLTRSTRCAPPQAESAHCARRQEERLQALRKPAVAAIVEEPSLRTIEDPANGIAELWSNPAQRPTRSRAFRGGEVDAGGRARREGGTGHCRAARAAWDELVEHTPGYPLLLPLASIAGILPGMAADTAGLPHRSLEGVTTLLFTASRGGRINLAIVSARFPSGWSRLRPRSASG
ncbi:MAG: hypothetical protein ACXVY6_06185 [Gaiellaceae bacterium]